MSVTIHEAELTIDDYEQEYDGSWRIFNGRFWTHACNTKEQAISRAKLWGGTHVGKAIFNQATGMNNYQEVVEV